MEGLRSNWIALQNASPLSENLFQHYGWCHHWCQTMLPTHELDDIRLLTVFQRDRLVFLLPLIQRQRLISGSVWELLSHPTAQYTTALFDPAHDADRLMELALEHLRDKGVTPDIIRLTQVPNTHRRVWAGHKNASTEVTDTAHVLDFTRFRDFDDHHTSLSKRTRKNLRQNERRFLRDHTLGEVVFQAGDPEFKRAIETMLTWKQERFQADGIVSNSVGQADFHALLSSLPAQPECSNPHCHLLLVDGNPAAGQLLLVDEDRLYAYFIAFDPQFARMSPGNHHLHRVLKWAFENGYRSYDLLGNPEEYKRKLCNTRIDMVDYVEAFSLRGRLALSLRIPTIKKGLKAGFYALPQSLRSFVADALAKRRSA